MKSQRTKPEGRLLPPVFVFRVIVPAPCGQQAGQRNDRDAYRPGRCGHGEGFVVALQVGASDHKSEIPMSNVPLFHPFDQQLTRFDETLMDRIETAYHRHAPLELRKHLGQIVCHAIASGHNGSQVALAQLVGNQPAQLNAARARRMLG